MKRNREINGQSRLTVAIVTELLESRLLFAVHNDSFDVTSLTAARSAFPSITGAGITVAVLDTGVDALNPDLSGKVLAYYNAVENAVPTTIGSASVSAAADNEGHGTHVSGIAASADSNIGVAYGAKLVDVKVIADSGESQIGGDPLLRGLDFVQDFANQFNIKVVNMSLGEATSSGGVNVNTVPAADDISQEIKVLQGMGITVVTAAGNSYANNPVPGESYPAVVSTISVASTWADTGAGYDFSTYSYGSSNDSFAAFENTAAPDRFSATSQRSTLANQVAAPGVDIYSDWNGSSTDNSGSDLLHNTLSGTSMASPFIAGAVALMQQAAITFGGRYITDPNQILSIIKSTADHVLDSNVADNGRVQISNGQLVSGQQLNLPETGDTFFRINVLKALQAVKGLFTGATSNADTDNTTASATVVPDLNGTQSFSESGVVGTDGLNQVGANDVDLYKLVLDSPGTFTAAMALPGGGTSFTASIRLFDNSGNQLARADGTSGSGYPTLSTDPNSPLAAGTYYVGISSLGNDSYNPANGSGAAGGATSGDYTLTVGISNPDPNGVPQGAVAVDLTNPNATLTGNVVANEYNGDLGSDPAPSGSSTRVPVLNGDVDMFKIVAPDTGVISAQVEATSFGFTTGADTYVRVFDGSFNEIAADGVNSSFASNSSVQFEAGIGNTYYVAVTNFANRLFDPTSPFNRAAGSTPTDKLYNLFLSFDNGNSDGTALLANTASVGQTISGSISSSNPNLGANGGSKYVDWYTYSVGQTGLFDLAATGTTNGFSPSLQLWTLSSDQTSINQVGSVTGSGAHLIDQLNANQTVYVSVTGQGNSNFNWFSLGSGSGGQTGSYSLSSALRPLTDLKTLSDNSVNSGSPATLSIGQLISGNIGQDNGLVLGATDVDLYKFTAPTSGRYDIRTNTSQEGSADTLLRLFDANGNQITSNDNASASSTASFIRTNLVAGQVYYIGVSGSGNAAYNALSGAGATAGSTGNYVIGIAASVVPAASVAAAATVQAPPPGGTAMATFTVSLDNASPATIVLDYATADGTAIAGQDYTATSGTLSFAPGQTSLTVSVPILHNDNAANTSTNFSLNLSAVDSSVLIAGGQAQATITNLPVTQLTINAKTPAIFSDATIGGAKVIVRLLGPGSGTVSVIGTDASGGVEITVNGSTAASSLVITPVTGAKTTISLLQINGSLAVLSAPRINLQGDLTITGTVRTLVLAGASGGHTLSIDGTGANGVVSLGDVSDLTFSTAEPLTALLATEWLNTDENTDTITAPRISLLRTNGAFAAGLTMNGVGQVIGTASFGSITGGTWTIDGSAGTIIAGSIAAPWAATFTGNVGALLDLGDESGSIMAATIGTLYVRKNMSGSNVTLTAGASGTAVGAPSVRTMLIHGSMTSSQVRSSGNINTALVGAMASSNIFAGVASGVSGLPADGSGFTSSAKISTLIVTGVAGVADAFSNSNIAAEQMGNVIVRALQPNNGRFPFGIATDSLALFADIEVGKKPVIWRTSQGASALATAADSGDFVVEVF